MASHPMGGILFHTSEEDSMEVRAISIEGVRIVAQALLSQGTATAPCSAFVGHDEAKGEWFAATYNHEGGFFFGTIYWQGNTGEAIAGAYQSFTDRVERDANRYLAFGAPLTEGTLHSVPEADLLEALKEIAHGNRNYTTACLRTIAKSAIARAGGG